MLKVEKTLKQVFNISFPDKSLWNQRNRSPGKDLLKVEAFPRACSATKRFNTSTIYFPTMQITTTTRRKPGKQLLKTRFNTLQHFQQITCKTEIRAMQHTVAFSSASEEWATPQDFYDAWNAVYQFDLDTAATDANAKAPRYYTKEMDGLTQPWEGTVWCNPPYGRGIDKWIQKGYMAARNGATVVMLIPARTDTRWWHDYVAQAAEIHFIKGRLKFGGHRWNAPFPSAVVVFRQPATPQVIRHGEAA